MKKNAIAMLLSFSLLGSSLSVNAINALSNKDDVIVSVNGKDKTESDLYDSIIFNAGYTPTLNLLDYKVMSTEFKDDKRLSALVEKKYSDKLEAAKETDPGLKNAFLLFNAKNKTEFIEKSGIMLEAYQELAQKETAANKLFKQSEIDYIYNHRFSKTAELYVIYTDSNLSALAAQDQKKIDEGLANSLKKSEDIAKDIKDLASFKAAASKNSSDAISAKKDGFIGEFTSTTARDAGVDQAIINAAFQLKENEVSKPVLTQFGYALVFAEKTKDQPKFEDVKKDVIDILFDIYNQNNNYTGQYSLFLYRNSNNLELLDPVHSKTYANSYLQTKKSYLQFDPAQQQGFGY